MSPTELSEAIRAFRARDVGGLERGLELAVRALAEVSRLGTRRIEVTHKKRTYMLFGGDVAGVARVTRPVWMGGFIEDPRAFKRCWAVTGGGDSVTKSGRALEQAIYTAQQAVGCYFDFVDPPAARKVAGTYFEAVVAGSLNHVTGLRVTSGTVSIPGEGEIRTDLALERSGQRVLLVATKTSTRERLSQPFVQKLIIDRATKPAPRSILVVIGDVQRVGESSVQHTFTAGQFRLYWKYVAALDGVYYIDVPPQAEKDVAAGRIRRLWQLFDEDLERLVKK